MEWINYHHLYYFWIIAAEGSVTAASNKLRLSQSTLSSQLKKLEESLNIQLFDRKYHNLILTESGRTVLDYANQIFSLGQEMNDIIRNRSGKAKKQVIRIGALSSMSKNLQFEFVKPCIMDLLTRTIVLEGNLSELIDKLENFNLDLVLSNMPVRTDEKPHLFNHPLGGIPVCMVGNKKFLPLRKNFPKSVNNVPLFVPNYLSRVRSELELYLHQNRIQPDIRAEVEDMALLRILALSGEGMSVVPQIAVRQELEEKSLFIIHKFRSFHENFFAIIPQRQKPDQRIQSLLRQFSETLKKEF